MGFGFPELLFLAFFAFGGILSLAALAIWILALVEVVTKEPSEGNDKIVWLLVVLLANWVGAIIYWLVRRPQRIREYGR
jgi:membrane protein DedA with SNARE-associated domain